jgi:gliding motility-associated-like protein
LGHTHLIPVTTVTYIVKDATGNQATCLFTVTITDNILPTITCPANISKNVDIALCNASVVVPNALIADNCSVASLTWTMTGATVASSAATGINQVGTYTFNTGVTTVTYIVKDAAGNQATCLFTVTITDNILPTITCPVNISQNDDAGACHASVIVPNALIADNCSVASLTWTMTGATVASSAATGINQVGTYTFNTGVTTVTYTVKDAAGNQATCLFTVTITDNILPTITCPSNIVHTADAGICSYSVSIPIPDASDNCGVSTIVGTRNDLLPLTNPYPVGVTTIHWVVTDVNGNNNSCDQTVTISDNEAPAISCPANIIVSCEGDTTPASTGTATASDNCTPAINIIIRYSDVSTYSADPSNVLHYNYTISRIWGATDIAGNFSECIQTITVHDITAPVVTCPADVTISCEADNSPAGTGTATATDICTPVANIAITFSDLSTYSSDPSNVLHYNYSINRIWKATDVAGNFSVCTQTITVHDITNPVITCPANVTISCEADNTPAGTGTATATDNCAPSANITVTSSDVSTYSIDPSNILHYNYVITRTWRATDVTGNFSVCTQTITVHDITNPTFTVPANITVCRASDCTYDIGISVTGDVTDEADNCTPGTLLNATFTDDTSGLIDCNNFGTVLRTWTLTDATGNTTTKIQTILIEPTPSVTVVNNSPIICDGKNVDLVFNSPTISVSTSKLNFSVTVSSTDPAHLGGSASTGFTVQKADLPFNLTGILTNSSDVPIVVTYTVTPELNGCSNGPDVITTVTVNPTPQVSPDILAQTICNDGTTSVTLGSSSTFTSGNISFNYTVTATGGVTGFVTPVTGLSKDFIITDVLHNPTDIPQTVTYTIVPISPSGCNSGPSKVVVITVNPTPQVLPDKLSQTICNNGTTSITLASPSTFTDGVITFNLTVTATGGVTGFATPVAGLPKDFVISDVLNNPTDAPQTVTYTIVPVSPGSCASGPAKVVVVSVNPTPKVNPDVLIQTICNDGTTNVVLGSPSTFTSGVITFNYTVTSTGGVTGYVTPVNGIAADYVISDILHNPTDVPQTVSYSVVPLSPNGCAAGPTKTIVVTVNPTPKVVPSALTQKICNNGVTSIVLASPSVFSNGNITFDYTVVATGGVTGYTTPVTGLPNDFVISDVLSNPTDNPQTVTYTIVPISPTGCAAGPPVVVVITVEPTPQVVPGPMTQTICNDGTTSIFLNSPSTFTNGVITFNYTVVATGGVTGFTTPVVGLPNNFEITDILHNPTDAPQTVTYTVVPISPECSANDPIKIVIVTVNPSPKVDPTPATQSICNDGNVNVVLNSPSTFTSGAISFNYSVVATGGVTGFTTPVTGISNGFIISDVLHNPTNAPQTVTYSIVPLSPTGCPDGAIKTVVITVNPTPQVIPDAVVKTICNDQAVNVTLGSPSTFDNGVITFSYSVIATGGVTGFMTPVTGLTKNYVINDVLHNPTDAPQTVEYTVIPLSPSGCAAGPSQKIVITVNPTPQVFPTPLAQSICNDGVTNISLESPSTFTSGVITFNYTVTATGGVTGYTTPRTGLLKGHVISDVLHNPTDAPQTVTYTIVPISPTGCPAGPIKNVVITVDPTPQVIPGTLAQTICNDGKLHVVLASSSTFQVGAITFNYTVVATGGVTGFTTPVTGMTNNFVISDVLHNPTDNPQTVTYTIVPISPSGCADGPSKVVVITVNPTPQVFPDTFNQIICNNSTTNVTLTSPSTFTAGVITFNYTVVATGGVTGFSPSVTGLHNNYILSDLLRNPTDVPQTVTYTIVPISPTGCPAGPSKVLVIKVNPTPKVVPSTLAQPICNDGTTSVVLTSPSIFTSGVITFNYTVVATGGVTGYTSPVTGLLNNSVISDVLHNPTSIPQTVTYTIVPISPNGCPAGPSKIVVITVNPTPQVIPSTLTQTICNKSSTNVILYSPSIFTSGVITFNYTVVATGGVTGFVTPVTGLANNHVISDVLSNPTDAPQTVTYKIIPISPIGCAPDPVEIVVVTVNPTPRIFPALSNSIQCDSLTTNVSLKSPSLFSNGLITFKYTVTSTGFIAGYSASASALPNNYIIADKLINSSDRYQVLTYKVFPVSPSGCSDGSSQTFTVAVNPTPRVTVANVYPSVCYTGTNSPSSTQVILTSPTVMTSGLIVFDYTVAVTGGITGNTSPETNRPQNYNINRGWQNNTDTIQSVYYSIIPKVDNSICVPGKKEKSEVKVHARPLQTILITKWLTCDRGSSGLAELQAVISKGASPYQVEWIGSFGYHKKDSLKITNLTSGRYSVKVTDNLGCTRSDSVDIVPKNARGYITADVVPPGNYNISCVGSTDGRILISVTGGITPPYNYWLVRNETDTLYSGIFTNNLNLVDPSTYRYFNNLGAGTYYLLIKDVNGCDNFSNPAKIVFKVPPQIVGTITNKLYDGNYNISCKGYNDGSATVVATGGRGGYTYRWYTTDGNIPGPINTTRIDNLIAGTYYVEIKDLLGCSQVQSTVIKEPDGMQLSNFSLSNSGDGLFNISCNGGSDGSISITISGGSGNYIYSWTGPAGFSATAKNLTGLKAGVYTCSVSDLNGCVLTPAPTFTLTEPTLLVINSITKSISTDGAYNINCYGTNTGWINISVSGGSIGNYTYNWSTSSGSGLINGQKDQPSLSAGSYHLVLTDANNCVVTKDITLTQPPEFAIGLTATNITCKSPGFNNGSIVMNVTGGIAPYTYLWSNGAVTKDITDLTPGVYTVTVTDLNGCVKTGTARIDLPPTLNYTKALSDYNGFNVSCNGLANGFIHVDPTSGSAPFIYTWTSPGGFNATTKDISNLTAGSYSLLIVDSNECKASETFNLTEPGKLDMTFNLSANATGGYNLSCAGDSTGYIDIIPVNQVKTVDYLWQDGLFGNSRNNLPAGNYTVIITDANNCRASQTITLTQPDSLKLTFTITPPFCPDKPDGAIIANVIGGISVTGYTYKWSDNSTNASLTNIPEGTYKVVVTDQDGCTVNGSAKVDPLNESCLVIPNAISPNGDLINDVWNIDKIELYPQMEVKIFNRWGEPIWRSGRGYPVPWDGTDHGKELPIDSYHYIIDLHNGSKPIIGNVTIVR